MASTQTSPTELDSRQAAQAFDIGLSKLQSSKHQDLYKRVLLLNSMDALVENYPSFASTSFAARFPSKEAWRKHMVQEFLATQSDDPDLGIKLLSSPRVASVDNLSILMNCLQITHRHTPEVRRPSSTIRSVKNKTIEKSKRIFKLRKK